MKAILEMDMPESCAKCDFCENDITMTFYCMAAKDEYEWDDSYTEERAPFCPLKERQENA